MSDQPSSSPAKRPAKRPARPHRRPQKDPVRFLAFEALRAVDERDAYANLVLPPLLKKARAKGNFDERDAALATELVYGTLRRQGTYDAVIAACIDRPLREVDPPVLDVLALGAHQLLGTRIPTHAAVSASVELARVVLGEGRAKFVNAVLRKISKQDLDAWVEQVARRTTTTPRRTCPSSTPTRAGSSPRSGTPWAAAGPASRTSSKPTTSGPR